MTCYLQIWNSLCYSLGIEYNIRQWGSFLVSLLDLLYLDVPIFFQIVQLFNYYLIEQVYYAIILPFFLQNSHNFNISLLNETLKFSKVSLLFFLSSCYFFSRICILLMTISFIFIHRFPDFVDVYILSCISSLNILLIIKIYYQAFNQSSFLCYLLSQSYFITLHSCCYITSSFTLRFECLMISYFHTCLQGGVDDYLLSHRNETGDITLIGYTGFDSTWRQ